MFQSRGHAAQWFNQMACAKMHRYRATGLTFLLGLRNFSNLTHGQTALEQRFQVGLSCWPSHFYPRVTRQPTEMISLLRLCNRSIWFPVRPESISSSSMSQAAANARHIGNVKQSVTNFIGLL